MMPMKTRYRLFERNTGIFFIQDNISGKQESLRTRDKQAALRLLHARNEAHEQPAINREIAKAYLTVSDPISLTRDWQQVMASVADTKTGNTLERWERAMREKPFDAIRNVKLIDTHADHFLHALKTGTISTNIFLRRLHNFALDMDWIPKAIIPRKQWPGISFNEKRGITQEEHEKISHIEGNPERRAFYELLWLLGGSQSDVATLQAEDVDWHRHTIAFHRMKTGSVAQLHFGDGVAKVLHSLPKHGPLFPRISKNKESDRAKQFSRSCKRLDITGISLHSYRYAWAERAKTCGYPERFAQQALGHNSAAVHRAYAKKAQVKLPSLEEYEKKIVTVDFPKEKAV